MAIEIYAGAKALKEIQQHGLRPESIKMMVGASGGPKWLMLSRLDQYLCEYFFPKAQQDIALVGSSIGSWRMALYAQKDPLARFKEFEDLYLNNQSYSEKLTPQEISKFVGVVLDKLFSGQYAKDIVHSANRKLHVVAVRNRLVFSTRSRLLQAFNLLIAATGNIFSQKIVEALYPRVLISQGASHEPYTKRPETIELNENNLGEALIASGAIPMVLEPTKIPGGKNRWHWDGGMVDYHFSGPFNMSQGLVLYPHFFPKLVPGWFDKTLPWRKVKAKDYDNVVMLVPSKTLISELPYGKIPDRKDFQKLSDTERLDYWHKVMAATDTMVKEFHQIMEKDGGATVVQPIDNML